MEIETLRGQMKEVLTERSNEKASTSSMIA